MPIYEYRCGSCGETLEVIQKLSDKPLRKCPHCAGGLEKLISRSAFMLKGGGWYAESYSKSSGNASGAAPKAAESNTDSSSSHGCKSGGCACKN
jgi:putative FmdB family regulatory protein